ANITTSGGDYTVVTPSPLSFTGNAGETQVISVDVVTDAVVEGNEVFTITLGTVNSAAASGIVSGAVGSGTINNDDTTTLSISGTPSVIEGSGGSTTMNFVVSSTKAVQGGF